MSCKNSIGEIKIINIGVFILWIRKLLCSSNSVREGKRKKEPKILEVSISPSLLSPKCFLKKNK
jgi:hypothetical protein